MLIALGSYRSTLSMDTKIIRKISSILDQRNKEFKSFFETAKEQYFKI